MIPLLITGGVVLLIIIWFISINNRLVSLKNNREIAFADIDVQLKQRYDLIPQLLGAVKGYMNHESEVLIKVTEARSRCMSAGSISEKIAAEGQMAAAMSGFNMQIEAYPDLKANQTLAQLTEELTSTENKVAFARQAYNDSVMAYNNRREVFPSSIVAGMFNFSPAALLDIPADKAEVREAPKVQF